MKKRLPVLLLALAMVFSFSVTMFACKPSEEGPGGTAKKKLVVWSMSNEVVELLNYHKLANPDYEYDFDITFINNDDGSYEAALDNAFSSKKGGPDLFLTDVDYTKKYVDSDHTVDLTKFYDSKGTYDSVRAMLEEDMYGYTLDIGTREGEKDELKAVSFQVTPGAMFYRADMFLTLIDNGLLEGVEDIEAWLAANELEAELKDEEYEDWPEAAKVKVDETMQAFVGDDMDKFKDAAKAIAECAYNEEKAETKKILMVNNLEDIKRVFYAQREAFVQDGKVVIDENIYGLFEYAKEIYPLTHKGDQWGDSWNAGMKAKNDDDAEYKTMAFFLPTWGLFYVLQNDDTAGLWRMIEGPQAYYWGGTYCMISKYADADKQEAAFDVLNFLTTLPFFQARAGFAGDVMNSKSLNAALASMDILGNPFLGGQNHYATFNTLAAAIDASNVTKYDSTVDRVLADVMKRYAAEDIEELDEAWEEVKDRLNSDLDMEVELPS
jgi:hypothetical protein